MILKRTAFTISVLLLLAVFVFNSLGYWLYFQVEQSEAKSEMQLNIHNGFSGKGIVVLTIRPEDRTQIAWLDKDEFSFGNKRYDVVKVVSDANGTRYYYCLDDKKENILFQTLEEHIKDHVAGNSIPGKSGKKVIKLLISEYFPSHQSRMLNEDAVGLVSFSYVFSIAEGLQKTPTPPPPQTGFALVA